MPTADDLSDLEILKALHEAAHAVAALRYRVPFDHVTIDAGVLPGGLRYGGLCQVISPNNQRIARYGLGGSRRWLWGDLIVSLAGYVTELQLGAPPAEVAARACHDLDVARARLAHLRRSFHDCATFGRAYDETVAFVVGELPAIRAVAVALMNRRRLLATEVAKEATGCLDGN